MKKTDKEVLEELLETLATMGKNCGELVAEYLMHTYPKASVIPMYRSAIAFEHDSKDYNKIHLYACGDPHCMGQTLDVETLKKWTNHMIIEGDRFGPILNYKCPNRKPDTIILSNWEEE
jgi:hypothetical protein